MSSITFIKRKTDNIPSHIYNYEPGANLFDYNEKVVYEKWYDIK